MSMQHVRYYYPSAFLAIVKHGFANDIFDILYDSYEVD